MAHSTAKTFTMNHGLLTSKECGLGRIVPLISSTLTQTNKSVLIHSLPELNEQYQTATVFIHKKINRISYSFDS